MSLTSNGRHWDGSSLSRTMGYLLLTFVLVYLATKVCECRPHEAGLHAIDGAGFLPDAPAGPMPQLLQMDVQCSKKSMAVRLRFDRPFQGLVYSKGHYGDPACRYLAPGGGLSSYEFVIHLDRCGTVFVEGPPDAYLENTIILQNEARVLEVWDTARKVRCQWTGQVARTVTSALGVGMLDAVAVTYSGDAAEAHLDVQLGKGPFAAPVNGLVKIGETLTAVISVQSEEGGDLDVHVKDCVAHDGDPRQSLQLTDSRGCVLKKKLMGPWQKTKHGGNLLAFAYLQAFKFPDKMELFLECNVEICKFQCPASPCGPTVPDHLGSETKPRAAASAPTEGDKTDKGKERSRRAASYPVSVQHPWNGPAGTRRSDLEELRLLKGIRVVSPDDLPPVSLSTSKPNQSRDSHQGEVCLSRPGFVASLTAAILLCLASALVTGALCSAKGRSPPNSKAILR